MQPWEIKKDSATVHVSYCKNMLNWIQGCPKKNNGLHFFSRAQVALRVSLLNPNSQTFRALALWILKLCEQSSRSPGNTKH